MVLVGLLVLVVFVLPKWVETQSVTARSVLAPANQELASPPESASVDADAVSAAKGENLRLAAQSSLELEPLRNRVDQQHQALRSAAVHEWGGGVYRETRGLIEAGQEQLRARDFDLAADAYRPALAHLERLETRRKELLAEALEEGRRALDSGDARAAASAFGRALAVAPGDRTAVAGAKRAEVVDEVWAQLEEGRQRQRRGDYQAALASFRRAVSLDRRSRRAQRALAGVQAQVAERDFARAMSAGLEALSAKDWSGARQAFERAQQKRPQAAEVADGIAQATAGERLERIAQYRREAEKLEQGEQWRVAGERYDAVLELDFNISFALEGRARSLKRAELSDALGLYVQKPDRLSANAVMAEAEATLEQAVQITGAGPRLERQRRQLEALLAAYRRPVRVQLVSDLLTDVVVYRVGRLGVFDSHTLELRPGTYTVVGTRKGYRDVRTTLVVALDQEPQRVIVRCEEKI